MSAPSIETEALGIIERLESKEVVQADGYVLEEWCAEFGSYVGDAIYDRLEALLHDLMCDDGQGCRCREPH